MKLPIRFIYVLIEVQFWIVSAHFNPWLNDYECSSEVSLSSQLPICGCGHGLNSAAEERGVGMAYKNSSRSIDTASAY